MITEGHLQQLMAAAIETALKKLAAPVTTSEKPAKTEDNKHEEKKPRVRASRMEHATVNEV